MAFKKNIRSIFIWPIVLIIMANGCASSFEDLTYDPTYSKYINQEYSMNVDCYVFCYLNDPATIFVGLGIMLPKVADPKYVGHSQNGVKILGIFSKGTVFKIAALHRERTFESSYYHYKIVPIGTLSEKWPLIDAAYITMESEKPPIILPEYALQIE